MPERVQVPHWAGIRSTLRCVQDHNATIQGAMRACIQRAVLEMRRVQRRTLPRGLHLRLVWDVLEMRGLRRRPVPLGLHGELGWDVCGVRDVWRRHLPRRVHWNHAWGVPAVRGV